MLKFRFTLHEVSWPFDKLAYSSGLMFGLVISAIALTYVTIQLKSFIKESITILK